MARYEVVGAAVVLGTSDGSERYLYKAAVIDGEAFTKKSIEHALGVGLIVPIVDAVEVEPVTEKNTVEEIDDFAAKFEIDLGDAKTTAEKVAVIDAVIAERTAAAEVTGVLQ